MGSMMNSNALVRKERLELSRLSALEPKSSASTNSATFAKAGQYTSGITWQGAVHPESLEPA
jgi:hypothetical protein